MNYYNGPWNNGGAFIGFHILGLLLGVTFIFLVVRVCLGGRYYHRHGMGTGGNISAIDMAKLRYAKGEISKEEFETLKKDLL